MSGLSPKIAPDPLHSKQFIAPPDETLLQSSFTEEFHQNKVMRVLVIGGTRFIGPWVVRGLCAAGCDVTVLHRGQHHALLPAGTSELLHPSAAMPVSSFPAEAVNLRPEIVVHMIAMGQADARAAVKAFAARSTRFVVLSSGDVYRAYGKFIGIEAGGIEEGLLSEDSALRTQLYPYRGQANASDDLAFYYEKILVEEEFLQNGGAATTVLRLPKVYGPGENSDLRTIYAYRNHPNWRWTHGYVENVAAAIVLAALHPKSGGRVYNVGEKQTPTVSERLSTLPDSEVASVGNSTYNFEQDIAFDTTRIRHELNYQEPVDYGEGLRRTLLSRSADQASG